MENASASASASRKGFSSFHLRKGQWFRLAAAAAALLGIILYIALPQILIEYKLYDNTSTAGARDYLFPPEYISGLTNLFGVGFFSYYLKSPLGPEVLTTQAASFNWFGLSLLIIAAAAIGLDLFMNFTAKNEKFSKIDTLLFVVAGLMCFLGPVFFLVTNHFGAADWTPLSDTLNYWAYDSLYVHDAYGAAVAGLAFLGGAALFGIGTNLEGGDKNDVRNQD